MTILEMLDALIACGDASAYVREDGMGGMDYDVTIEDFEGFDGYYNEIDREFVNEELVDEFLGALRSQALATEGSFYRTYIFEHYSITIGYASYDI